MTPVRRSRQIIGGLSLLLTTATGGCRLEAPLAPTPSADATLVTLVVTCGRWVSTGETCMARGLYSDRGERDLTTDATWDSSDSSVATVDGAGRVTFASPGEVTIRAAWPPLSASTRISTRRPGPV